MTSGRCVCGGNPWPYPDGDDLRRVEDIVYRLVAEAGGCISGEHGMGVIKKPFLGLRRGEGGMTLMREIKRLLDPAGVLNDGGIFDPG